MSLQDYMIFEINKFGGKDLLIYSLEKIKLRLKRREQTHINITIIYLNACFSGQSFTFENDFIDDSADIKERIEFYKNFTKNNPSESLNLIIKLMEYGLTYVEKLRFIA